MRRPIPIYLEDSPLIEAIWQAQFESEPDHPLGDILPGVLFTALRAQQPHLQLNRLPWADIPTPIAENDPNLRYAAKYRIEAPGWPFLFHVGDRVVTANCRVPYPGWNSFRGNILQLINILETSQLILKLQQHSLRYINLITLESPPSLASLQMTLQVGEYNINQHPLQLRVELPSLSYKHILQIVTPAQAHLSEGDKQGTIVDLEAITPLNQKSWSDVRESLQILHDSSKEMFFRQIVDQEAVRRMKPEYPEW
jgi:uncharacterized protein (TIGR04255 family)